MKPLLYTLIPLCLLIACTNIVNPASNTLCDASAHQVGTYKVLNNFTATGTCVGVPGELLLMTSDNKSFVGVDCNPIIEDDDACIVSSSSCVLNTGDSVCTGNIDISFADDGSTAVATDAFNCKSVKTAFACDSVYTIHFVKP